MKIMVTGGCGFIGSNFIRMILHETDYEVVNIDKLTYAGSRYNLGDSRRSKRYKHYKLDINSPTIPSLLAEYKPVALFHFAAESHVDRSINDSLPFLKTNVMGTANLLEAVRQTELPEGFRFIHVSTDEVYGSLDWYSTPSNEDSPYQPRSPYAASKAASDHLVNAYHITHGLPTIITNCSNNYGLYQHPEKLIPKIITRANAGLPIPIYGTGENIRDWIHVSDHCAALLQVLEHGHVGEKYNIGGGVQIQNFELAMKILDMMDKPQSLIKLVADRKGHDFRYDIDTTKLRTLTNWKPEVTLERGLKQTIEFYTKNPLGYRMD